MEYTSNSLTNLDVNEIKQDKENKENKENITKPKILLLLTNEYAEKTNEKINTEEKYKKLKNKILVKLITEEISIDDSIKYIIDVGVAIGLDQLLELGDVIVSSAVIDCYFDNNNNIISDEYIAGDNIYNYFRANEFMFFGNFEFNIRFGSIINCNNNILEKITAFGDTICLDNTTFPFLNNKQDFEWIIVRGVKYLYSFENFQDNETQSEIGMNNAIDFTLNNLLNNIYFIYD